MKTGVMLGVGALVVAAVAVAAMPVQDPQSREGEPMGGPGAEEMAAWMAAAVPGPEHADLQKAVGTWDLTVRWWMDPNGPPMESKSTAVREMILGGRYLVEKVKGDMGAMGPFEGQGTLGYNNITKQYDQVWMDSMGTGMMISHGTVGADGTMTMHGEFDNPLGGTIKTRTVMHHVNDNEQRFEMFEDRGQGETKSMEILYKRSATAR